MSPRPTVLFVADTVTLAHVARPLALARGLDPAAFHVFLACDARYRPVVGEQPFPIRPLRSLASEVFLKAAARGCPLYDYQTLCGYVREDLALLKSVQPDAVVGDHRLSLAISARVAGIPYLNITNAYWSPYAERATPLPELPMNRWLGIPLAQRIFDFVWPLAAAWHSLPLNRVRHDYRLPALGWDWLHAYTDGDRTLYADACELVPSQGLPSSHTYLGPIAWSPPVELPAWWTELSVERPLVYVTLGSSGRAGLLERVLEALAELPLNVVATTAGKGLVTAPPSNAHLLDYGPGDRIMERADLMICNGGSLTVYQALTAGKPLIGIAAHMDQHMSMRFVEKAGVGVTLRSDLIDGERLRAAVGRMLTDHGVRQRARDMAAAIADYTPASSLSHVLRDVTAGRAGG
ncbi:MAG TPA: glycosyltransferase [Thiobacillaceae bacterium]|nr:glycosyltransferase [Thiobacillaceae bacterium]